MLLWSSCVSGHTEVAALLLESGASVNLCTTLHGGIHTGQPLHAAAAKGHVALVRLLLANSAQPEAVKAPQEGTWGQAGVRERHLRKEGVVLPPEDSRFSLSQPGSPLI